MSAVHRLCRPAAVFAALVLLGAAWLPHAFAQNANPAPPSQQQPQPPQQGGGQQDLSLPEQLVQAQCISVEIPLPLDHPSLKLLRRKPIALTDDQLKSMFLSEQNVVRVEPAVYRSYGQGKRYVVDDDTYLVVYRVGFEYNGDAKVGLVPVKKTAFDKDNNPVYSFAYTADDGKAAALKMVEKYVGLPKECGDFKLVYNYPDLSDVKKFDAKWFTFTISKTYRDVPLLDDYIQVVLDGDKNLVAFSYYWDDDLTPYGDETPTIDSGFAVNQAKLAAISDYNGQPPLFTLFNIKLGYVNYRKDPTVLAPVWMMELKYNEVAQKENKDQGAQGGLAPRFVTDVKHVTTYFAIDAIWGWKFDL